MGINAQVTRSTTTEGAWEFTWGSGFASPYSIWLDGVLLDTVDDESYTFDRPGYDEAPPDLEIVETGETAESETYPPYVVLQWRGSQDAAAYDIEQYISGVWTVIATVMETGQGYYQWTSQPLEDLATEQYRVTPVRLGGADGTPLSFTTAVCRNPPHPEVELSIDSTGDVIVSEA